MSKTIIAENGDGTVTLRKWLVIIAGILTIGTTIYALVSNRSKKDAIIELNAMKVPQIEEKIGDHETRISKNETGIENLNEGIQRQEKYLIAIYGKRLPDGE